MRSETKMEKQIDIVSAYCQPTRKIFVPFPSFSSVIQNIYIVHKRTTLAISG